MDQVLFVIIVLVILYMFKDKWLKYMPNIVKKNVLVSGLVFGFALCYFMGNNIEGFDVTNSQEAIEFQGSCCNLYDGTRKRRDQFADIKNPITNEMNTRDEQISACYDIPEGSNEAQIEPVRDALCFSVSTDRTFTPPGGTTLQGGAAHAMFRTSCCVDDGSGSGPSFTLDTSPGSIGDQCFQYAFGKTMQEITVQELFSDMNEFYEMCQSQGGD